MANYDSEFGNIEKRKRDKRKLKKIWKYAEYAAALTFGWAFIYFFMLNEKNIDTAGFEFKVLDFLVIDYTNLKDLVIDIPVYFSISVPLFFLLWSLLLASSKSELLDELARLNSQKSKIPWGLKQKINVASMLDPVIYYFMYPISYLVIATDSGSAENRKKYFMRHGWLSHLEKNFFKQTVHLIDGYQRSSRLNIFKDYPALFSDEQNAERAIKSQSFQTMVSFFKSKKSLEDVFYISEGYICDEEAMKYDKLLSKEEFEEILERDFGGVLENFRVYDGRDNIYFSFDLMKRLIDTESKRFHLFMSRYALDPTGLEFSRSFRKHYDLLIRDKNTLDMIRQVYCPAPLSKISDMNKEELVRRVLFIFDVYFRFFAFFYIVNQYINLPAGTVVVRMDDYTLRMITETYDNKNIVSIEARKNDGSTDSFKGDALTNMFLLAWNYYNYSVENSFHKKVYNIYNLRDEAMDNALSGRDESVLLAQEIQEHLGNIDNAAKPELSEKQLEEASSFLLS